MVSMGSDGRKPSETGRGTSAEREVTATGAGSHVLRTGVARVEPEAIPDPLDGRRGTDAPPRRKRGAVALALFGIVLPSFALLVELSNRICTEHFFDPLPTPWHVAFFASIIVASWFALSVGSRMSTGASHLAAALLGFAVVAAGVYSLVFLPILPISMLALLVGLGFLSLSPIFALPVLGTVLARHLGVEGPSTPKLGRSAWIGVGLALLVLLLMEAPPLLAHRGLTLAADPDPEVRAHGLALIRGWGDEDEVLRRCYVTPRRRSGLFGGSRGRATSLFVGFAGDEDDVTRQQARAIYYRATGRPFNSVAPPGDVPRSMFDFDRDFRGWEEQGGDVVAGRISGLRLTASRLDGSVDVGAALAYLEWTLEFQNSGRISQEARAELVLPPGGTVSRLTLWVNDAEREAVFGPRERVTRAYKNIVERPNAIRDPVLVRTSGPDRIFVQCFPVLPNGPPMKIRIGITAPVELDGSGAGWIGTPCIAERNFDVPEQPLHALWWSSRAAIEAPGAPLVAEHPGRDEYVVRGMLTNAQLGQGRGALKVKRAGGDERSWTPDPTEPDAWRVVQQITEAPAGDPAAPSVLAVVIDGSRLMEHALPAVAGFVEALPPGIRLHVLVAREEEPEVLAASQLTSRESTAAVADELRDADARGGCDAVPALLAACDAVRASPGGRILWVHGPQPVVLRRTSALAQVLDRGSHDLSVLALQAVRGPNRILGILDVHPGVRTLARRGDLGADLERVLAGWQDEVPRRVVERRRVPATELDEVTAGRRVSRNLAKLWARDAVDRRLQTGRYAEATAAQQIATAHRIVVPVTAAVVLERDQQYLDAGLALPSDDVEDDLLEMAEPELWLLLIAVVVLLVLVPRTPRRGMAATGAILALALALKLHYSHAGADALAWVLAPTAWLVELVTHAGFRWEADLGYVSGDGLFAITKSCAGVNFLIVAFAMLALAWAWRARSGFDAVRATCTAALVAFAATIAANVLRILVAMPLGTEGEGLHRLIGVVVYFGALCGLYALCLRPRKTLGVGWLVPLGFYLAITLAVPLARAWILGVPMASREHVVVLLTVPAAILALIACLRAVRALGGRHSLPGA